MSGEHEHIEARAVRPGDLIWNPYGGPRGHAEVTSEPRERPDGTIEFDCADGRTGRFFPHSRLRLRRAAMERRDADREAERLAGDEAWPDEETRQVAEADAWGGRGPSASYAEWLAEGWDPEAGAMTVASDSGGIRIVPLAALATHPLNPRPGLGNLAELAASIAAQGLFEPWSCPVSRAYAEAGRADEADGDSRRASRT